MAPDRGVEAQGSDNTYDSTTLPTSLDRLTLTNDPPSDLQPPDPSIDIAPQSQPPSASQSIPPHLSHDPATNAKRTDPFQFGQRYLSAQDDVFEYNAWDHVEPDNDHLEFAQEQYTKQRAAPVSEFDYRRFNEHPEKWWDLFYKQKSASFFKDRKWLVQEFPVLADVTRWDAGERVVLEVGAGAGNTAFPVMRMNENEGLRVWAVDFSKRAVETMREAEDYAAIGEGRDGRKGEMHAEIWDVAGDELPEGMEEGMADVVIMIFIFSALSPKQWARAVRNVWRVLKPGGEVLFRDYGRGDLAQVRFKAGRWMEENFYVRGDGTRVYFFEKEELEEIWTGEYWSHDQGRQSRDQREMQEQGPKAGEQKTQEPSTRCGDEEIQKTNQEVQDDGVEEAMPCFDVLNLDIDRRLIDDSYGQRAAEERYPSFCEQPNDEFREL
ncbi:hypothetical protein LTR70_005429 [Exophiala xenobiotica]|uniref:Methyltransferase type 12 domain-containing protein n=1 Tax=Lithohypha guttulata TaxID=1690604 RepID=A0ABR0KBB6_9EURO|nr:hypothetical protein LTR24_005171 [Lithohypha guttulata]KAK5318407.1 hypothetical protein LTR70_005429 [Exophiala xenobiotica]